MAKWKIAKYIRLSQADRDLGSNDQKSESESISHQRNLIESFISGQADLMDCEQEEFYDDGYSGTNFDRPAFERMLEKIRRAEINCVIVKDFSRFGRDYIELGDYLERIFPVLGVRFISINDRYDSENYKGTTGGMDVVMKNIVYTYYSRDLSTKVKTAKRMRMKRGEIVNGMVPYGYQKDPKDHHHLILDPVTSKVVREIFDLFLSGTRPDHIAVLLNDRKYDTPAVYYRKNHPDQKLFKDIAKQSCWNGSIVKHILTRKAYYGAVVSHTMERTDWSSKKVTRIPEEEQIVVEGMHEAIVTKEEFLRAQERFRTGGHVVVVKGDYPLFKKVRCGVCGRSCRRDVRTKIRTPKFMFFCSYARSQNGEVRCSQDMIEEDTIMQIVWEKLKRLILLTDASKKKINDALWKTDQERKALEKCLDDLQKSIKKIESEKMALMEKYLSREITKNRFQSEKTIMEEQTETLRKEVSEKKNKLAELTEWRNVQVPDDLEKIKKCAAATELTKEIADITLKQVTFYDKEHLEIVWKVSDGFLEMVGMNEENAE